MARETQRHGEKKKRPLSGASGQRTCLWRGYVRMVPDSGPFVNNSIKAQSIGISAPSDRPTLLIDQNHRIIHRWKPGDVNKLNEYLYERALHNNKFFQQLLQALIELAEHNSQEHFLRKSISNHGRARGQKHEDGQT